MKRRIYFSDGKPPDPDEPPAFIKPGKYRAQIVGYIEKKSRYSQREYWQWKLKPEGVHPEFYLWHITVLEDYTEPLAELMEAVHGIRPLGAWEIDPEEFLDAHVTVHVGTAQYREKVHNRIERVEADE